MIYRSCPLFSRCLLLSKSHITLASKYFTKYAGQTGENLQFEYFKSVVDNNHDDWITVRNNILLKERKWTEKNIDAVILKYLISLKKFDSAFSFANFLFKSGCELNLGVTNSLLHMYYEFSKINKLSEESEKFILYTYKSLYDKYKVLDYFTCEKLLHALCAIDEWKKSLKVLADISLSSTPSHSAYSVLIATLFKNNKYTEAFKVIQRSLNDRRPLQDNVYDEWLKYILRKYKTKSTILKYLDEVCFHLAENYTTVSEATATRISETFISLGWSGNFASVNRDSGLCSCCNGRLDDIKLSEEEFLLLQQNVKKRLIVGSDLFLKTSPGELEAFTKYIDRTGPYDIVLDGLNIAFLIGKGTNMEKIKILSNVVDYFVKQNKKILLLGRKHMQKWNLRLLKDITSKTFSFYTDNLSQDDPYFITAAILSGSHTDIVSRDLLRGHRFLMKDEQLRLLFQRWQWKHQWMVFPSRKRPLIQAPLNFTPCAQKNGSVWHIPYTKIEETDEQYLNKGEPDLSWLCLKEPSK